MGWPAHAGQLNSLKHDYCEPGLRPVTRSISDTDGKAPATGSPFSADVVAAGGGFAAAVAEGGDGSRAGGAAEAGGGNAVLVAEGAGGAALGAGGGFFDSLSRSTSDCDGKASVAYSTEEEDEQETSNGSAPAAIRTCRRAARARPMFCPALLTRLVPSGPLLNYIRPRLATK
jgi:hypothetical protein